jgi:eukaryotic-like serine/threonine-protein kinase
LEPTSHFSRRSCTIHCCNSALNWYRCQLISAQGKMVKQSKTKTGSGMITIRLRTGEWKYDPKCPLGPEGGFGEVFLGENRDGESVAVKRLKITASAAAHRELKIADWIAKNTFSHIMPCYDSGQDSESDMYFLVMPQAELSLEAKIQQEGLLCESESVKILLEIVNGLIEAGELVHRDMKPGNILYYQSSWHIADFGIARFVEESTSLRTLKGCLSPPYAAPEQWKYERATHETDVYALGCIGYTLLTGKPPFSGPTTEDYKNQHLHDEPPLLPECSSLLKSLLLMTLRKVPESRPSFERIPKILETVIKKQIENSGKRLSALAEAGASVVQQQAEEESKEAKERAERERRNALAQQAEAIFIKVREELFLDILAAAPAAIQEDNSRIRLGKAVLIMQLIGEPVGYPAESFPLSKWDVVLGGKIVVRQDTPRYIWSSSLWFSKIVQNGNYRWREVSYFGSPFLNGKSGFEPHYLEDIVHADEASGPGIAAYQVAFGPQSIDDEDVDDFKERWCNLFTKAVNCQLCAPRSLPLK